MCALTSPHVLTLLHFDDLHIILIQYKSTQQRRFARRAIELLATVRAGLLRTGAQPCPSSVRVHDRQAGRQAERQAERSALKSEEAKEGHAVVGGVGPR